MTMLIIGSTAAKHHFPDWREPKDLDAFSPNLPANGDAFWDDRLRPWFDHRVWDGDYATPSELLTIKTSHAYWDLHGTWSKHMVDLLELKRRGAVVIPWLHDLLYKVWEGRHGKKQVDLTIEAEEFFTDQVRRLYDHDALHRSVAYTPGKPLYEEALKDGKSVQMDMTKVWNWPHDRIMAMFREEIYVTALERILIPKNYTHSAGAAYQWALRRTITSLTKGRSARYLVDHFDELVKPDCDYVARHRAGAHFLEKL